VALVRAGGVAALVDLKDRGAHARDLLESIDRLLQEQGLEPGDLAGIGVAAGPGSFTGVRVGMATAKGLSYALGIGLLGISTLEALAHAALLARPAHVGPICPIMESGRGEVYAALFLAGPEGLARPTPDRSLRPEDLAPEIPAGALLVGDGARRVSRGASADWAVLEPPPPIAGAIALRAAERLDRAGGYRPGEAAPNYVRPSDARAPRLSP
jgi:tRNA threonylcarbamoyl adenosine modification protein YeaZ